MVIKTTVILLASLLLSLPGSFAAEGDFAKTLTPEETQSAGLPKLTPGELSRLEALVERYKSGQVEVAQKAAGQAVKAPLKTKKLVPDWVGALITLQRSSDNADKDGKADALESRIAGNFNGWSGRTSFKLENGQLWIQANSDSYPYSPPLNSPKVKIYPASLGSYWMEIEGTNQRCRVKPVRLE